MTTSVDGGGFENGGALLAGKNLSELFLCCVCFFSCSDSVHIAYYSRCLLRLRPQISPKKKATVIRCLHA